jgi:hypothetical protein
MQFDGGARSLRVIHGQEERAAVQTASVLIGVLVFL